MNTTVISKNKTLLGIMLGILAGVGPLCIDLYLPALPQIAEVFHATTSQTQLSLTAVLLGLALGQIIIGGYSDIFGRKKPLMISLTLFSISTFICAFSPSIKILILFRFIQGLSGSGGVVLSRAVAKDLYSGAELTKFFALLMLINGIAPIAAPVLGGQLIKFTNWSGILFVLGIFSILILISSMIILKESLPAEKRSKGGVKEMLFSFIYLFKNKPFMSYIFCQGFAFGGMFAYIAGSPFVLQKIYGLSPQMFSLCFAINALGIVLGTYLTGVLISKYSELRLLIAGLFLSAVGALLFFTAIIMNMTLVFVMGSLFLYLSSRGIISTTCTSLAMKSQEKSAGSASALLGLMIFVMGAIAAPVVGIKGESSALPMAAVIIGCTILSVLSIVGILKSVKKEKTWAVS